METLSLGQISFSTNKFIILIYLVVSVCRNQSRICEQRLTSTELMVIVFYMTLNTSSAFVFQILKFLHYKIYPKTNPSFWKISHTFVNYFCVFWVFVQIVPVIVFNPSMAIIQLSYKVSKVSLGIMKFNSSMPYFNFFCILSHRWHCENLKVYNWLDSEIVESDPSFYLLLPFRKGHSSVNLTECPKVASVIICVDLAVSLWNYIFLRQNVKDFSVSFTKVTCFFDKVETKGHLFDYFSTLEFVHQQLLLLVLWNYSSSCFYFFFTTLPRFCEEKSFDSCLNLEFVHQSQW